MKILTALLLASYLVACANPDNQVNQIEHRVDKIKVIEFRTKDSVCYYVKDGPGFSCHAKETK